jgi:hypothetical protein
VLNDEDRARVVGELALIDAARAQPLGAGALEELQVVGIEDDAACIGILVVHAHRPDEAARGVRERVG